MCKQTQTKAHTICDTGLSNNPGQTLIIGAMTSVFVYIHIMMPNRAKTTAPPASSILIPSIHSSRKNTNIINDRTNSQRGPRITYSNHRSQKRHFSGLLICKDFKLNIRCGLFCMSRIDIIINGKLHWYQIWCGVRSTAHKRLNKW